MAGRSVRARPLRERLVRNAALLPPDAASARLLPATPLSFDLGTVVVPVFDPLERVFGSLRRERLDAPAAALSLDLRSTLLASVVANLVVHRAPFVVLYPTSNTGRPTIAFSSLECSAIR
jgi:hypothetical protein